MAVAYVNGSVAGNGQTATTSSLSISVPSGAATGHDAVLLVASSNDTVTLTTPTGWTLVSGPDRVSTSESGWLFRKTLVSGDVGATVTLTFSTAQRCNAVMAVMSGTTTTGLLTNSIVETTSSGNATLPSVNSVPAGSFFLGGFARRFGGTSAPDVATITNYTAGSRSASAYTTVPNLSTEFQYQIIGTGGTYGGDLASVSTSSVGVDYSIVFPPSAPPGDTTPPTVPGSVSASLATSTSATISWTASTDAVGVSSYRIRRDGTDLAGALTLAGSPYTDTGLTAGTTYTYTVSAVDAAGNRSAESSPATITTPLPNTGLKIYALRGGSYQLCNFLMVKNGGWQ